MQILGIRNSNLVHLGKSPFSNNSVPARSTVVSSTVLDPPSKSSNILLHSFLNNPRKTATVERSAERLFVENQSKAFTYAFPDEADKISVRLYENGSGRVDFGPDESSTIV